MDDYLCGKDKHVETSHCSQKWPSRAPFYRTVSRSDRQYTGRHSSHRCDMLRSTVKQSGQPGGCVTWEGSHSEHASNRLKGAKSQSSHRSEFSHLKRISSRCSRISATTRPSPTAVMVQSRALPRISNHRLGYARDSSTPHAASSTRSSCFSRSNTATVSVTRQARHYSTAVCSQHARVEWHRKKP